MVGVSWLLLGYLLHTTGELCVSPVGLSMVTRLSPARIVSHRDGRLVHGHGVLAVPGRADRAAHRRAHRRARRRSCRRRAPPSTSTATSSARSRSRRRRGAGSFALSPLLVRWMHREARSAGAARTSACAPQAHHGPPAAEPPRLVSERPRAPARAARAEIAAACRRRRRRSRSASPLTLALWATVNTVYQVIRKPTRCSSRERHAQQATCRRRGASTRRLPHRSTAAISPEFLAALAQVEASGNPVARAYWRWTWTLDPLDVYRPRRARSASIRSPTARSTRRAATASAGHPGGPGRPLVAWQSFWFNWLLFRIMPSHSVELTAAYLDRAVAGALARYRIRRALAPGRRRTSPR